MPYEVWCNDDLIAAYQPGTTDTLAVCFLSFGGHSREEDIRSRCVRQTSIVSGGVNNALYLTDMTWTCCMRPEIRDRVVTSIRKAADQCGAKKIVAFGNSAGGSSAIYLNTYAGFDAVLATSPQVDLRLASHAFDIRWKRWMRFYDEAFAFPSLGPGFATNTPIVVAHGLRRRDAAQAAMVPSGAHIHQYLFPDLAHDLKPRLQPKRRISRIFNRLIDNNIPAIDTIITNAGGLKRGQLDYAAETCDWDLLTASDDPKDRDLPTQNSTMPLSNRGATP